MTHFVDKQNVVKKKIEDMVLKRIMTEFLGRNFSLASVKSG